MFFRHGLGKAWIYASHMFSLVVAWIFATQFFRPSLIWCQVQRMNPIFGMDLRHNILETVHHHWSWEIYICLQGACSVASPFFTLVLIYSQAGLKNKSLFWHGLSPQIFLKPFAKGFKKYIIVYRRHVFASQFFRLTCAIRLVGRMNLRHGPWPVIVLTNSIIFFLGHTLLPRNSACWYRSLEE